ncbi:MAG: flagellar export chaperone FlgN [Acidobacteriota bacterium]
MAVDPRKELEPIRNSLAGLVDTCRTLLTEQGRVIDCYLEGKLDEVAHLQSRQERLLREARGFHDTLARTLAGGPLSEVARLLEAPQSEQLEQTITDLHRLLRELHLVNLRNRRFIQSSLCYSQALLQEVFSTQAAYNGGGVIGVRMSGLKRDLRV